MAWWMVGLVLSLSMGTPAAHARTGTARRNSPEFARETQPPTAHGPVAMVMETQLPFHPDIPMRASTISDRGGQDVWELPADFRDARIFVRPVTVDGDTLNLLTDTGGGLFVFSDVAARFPTAGQGVVLPPFRPGLGVPTPLGSEGGVIPLMAERPPVVADGMDGMLGQAWFSGRVWEIDYPGRRFAVLPSAASPEMTAHTVPLGFRTGSDGNRLLDFPRLRVVVDGDSLDLLLDTGATVNLTDAAKAVLGGSPVTQQGTSFITSSTLAVWRTRHPDWPVVVNADALVPGMSMIRVPEVKIASVTVGPVWFTERPDRNFREYMSQFMDRDVEGALGGSALQYLRLRLDYPNARLTVERRQ